MGIEEQILDYQLNRCVFDNAKFSETEGIARKAVSQGFNSLTAKQKAVLQPYLSQNCTGITVPGGYHNDCSVLLEGEELLNAYQRCDDTECLVCESSDNEEGYHAQQWERISSE